MRAKLIRTEGPWLEANIQTEFGVFTVMDCISCDEQAVPSSSEEFEAELAATVLAEQDWDTIFNGNPDRQKRLQQLSGWRYLGYGIVESVRPTVIDCGALKLDGPIQTNDDRVIGSYVCVIIDRLELFRRNDR
jgi:hypothetical protein